MINFFLILSLKLTSHAFAETLVAKVQSIHDGDTISVTLPNQSKKEKVRLLGVDTPEVDFNGQTQGEIANMARDYLQKLLPLNSTIQIELPEKGRDVNGRLLGKIIYNGVDLNLEMLKAGMGVVYFIYPYDKKTVVEYMSASELADLMSEGLFADNYKKFPPGYIFRQSIRGVDGTNFVANYETKKIYSSKDIESVPHFHRVFFSSEETALIHGFNW